MMNNKPDALTLVLNEVFKELGYNKSKLKAYTTKHGHTTSEFFKKLTRRLTWKTFTQGLRIVDLDKINVHMEITLSARDEGSVKKISVPLNDLELENLVLPDLTTLCTAVLTKSGIPQATLIYRAEAILAEEGLSYNKIDNTISGFIKRINANTITWSTLMQAMRYAEFSKVTMWLDGLQTTTKTKVKTTPVLVYGELSAE